MLKFCNEYTETLQYAASKTTRLVGKGFEYSMRAWSFCIGRPVNRVLGVCLSSHRNPDNSIHAYYMQGKFEEAARDLEAQPLEPNCQIATDIPCCAATAVTAGTYGASLALLSLPTLAYVGIRSAAESCYPSTFTHWSRGQIPPHVDEITDEHVRRIAHWQLYCAQLDNLYKNVLASGNGILIVAHEGLQKEIAQHDPIALSYVIWCSLENVADNLESDPEFLTKPIQDNNDSRVRTMYLLRALRDYTPADQAQHAPIMKAVAKRCEDFLTTFKTELEPLFDAGFLGSMLSPLPPLSALATAESATHETATSPPSLTA